MTCSPGEDFDLSYEGTTLVPQQLDNALRWIADPHLGGGISRNMEDLQPRGPRGPKDKNLIGDPGICGPARYCCAQTGHCPQGSNDESSCTTHTKFIFKSNAKSIFSMRGAPILMVSRSRRVRRRKAVDRRRGGSKLEQTQLFVPSSLLNEGGPLHA